MSFVTGLRCRECGRPAEVAAVAVCELCFGPLEVVYDVDAQRRSVSRASIAGGPPTLWRYADLLPELDGPGTAGGETNGGSVAARHGRVDLGAGMTPLVAAPRLGEALGLADLWVKNDTLNPSGSFKDRVVSVALTAARRLGLTTAACASTGNLAQSVAAHAAATGMPAVVFVPADLERAKIVATAAYGPTLVAVDGTYDDANRLCAEAAGTYDWAFVNINVRPYYAEGSKTIGFEIAEQFGWRLPDHVVAPMASGSMLVKIDKAFGELVALELVADRPWRISGAQASGCAPIAAAHKDGSGHVRPVRPATIAKSLAIGNPADGPYALDAVARTGGAMEDVDDAEIAEAMGLLSRSEGILAETAGGVTIAVLRKLVASGRIEPSERTVAVVSGHGLKTLDAFGGAAGASLEIPPSLDALDAALRAA
ncbi:MAG: threonine synthase [Euzebyales bacterium]|nr:threonine synthase [Euzebyales bacterium]